MKSHYCNILSYAYGTLEYTGPAIGHTFVKLIPGVISSSNDMLTPLSH